MKTEQQITRRLTRTVRGVNPHLTAEQVASIVEKRAAEVTAHAQQQHDRHVAAEQDRAAVNAGIDTGSTYAELRRGLGKLW